MRGARDHLCPNSSCLCAEEVWAIRFFFFSIYKWSNGQKSFPKSFSIEVFPEQRISGQWEELKKCLGWYLAENVEWYTTVGWSSIWSSRSRQRKTTDHRKRIQILEGLNNASTTKMFERKMQHKISGCRNCQGETKVNDRKFMKKRSLFLPLEHFKKAKLYDGKSSFSCLKSTPFT